LIFIFVCPYHDVYSDLENLLDGDSILKDLKEWILIKM